MISYIKKLIYKHKLIKTYEKSVHAAFEKSKMKSIYADGPVDERKFTVGGFCAIEKFLGDGL